MMRIIDKNYQSLDILSNETSQGMTYQDHRLRTTITDGLYTLEFKVDKRDVRHTYLEIGNMIETKNRQGKQLLLTISRFDDDTFSKTIYAEDGTISILNGYVDAIVEPIAPESLSYYVNHVLNGTNYKINVNESEVTKKLKFTSAQRRLERLREIANAFSVELAFETHFEIGKPPLLLVSFYKKRREVKEEFRVSTDDLLIKPERSRNIYNLATRMFVAGAVKENKNPSDKSSPEKTPTPAPTDAFAEAMINRAFELKKRGLRYQWGGNGNPSYDCSGYMQACIEAGGQRVSHRATTYTMKNGQFPFKVISINDIKRGDLIMYDTGYTYPGDWNHVGLYLGKNYSEIGNANTVIHAGDPVGTVQRANSMKIMGAVRVTRP